MTKQEILDRIEECRRLRAWGRDDEADGHLASLAINLHLDLQSEADRAGEALAAARSGKYPQVTVTITGLGSAW